MTDWHPDLTETERAEIIAERDHAIRDRAAYKHRLASHAAGTTPLDPNPLLPAQIEACDRHIARYDALLAETTNGPERSALDESRALRA